MPMWRIRIIELYAKSAFNIGNGDYFISITAKSNTP